MNGAGARAKGMNAEREICDLFNQEGIPTIRQIGSGRFSAAKGDIKIGVPLTEDGELPNADEVKAFIDAECKNRMSNPEWLHDAINGKLVEVANVRLMDKLLPEQLIHDIEQDDRTTVVILRRKRLPAGNTVVLTRDENGKAKKRIIKKGRYNETHMVCMGMQTFVNLIKKAAPNLIVDGLFERMLMREDQEEGED